MSRATLPRRVLTASAVAGAVAGGAAAALYGAARFATARLRAIPDDPGAERLLAEPVWVSRRLASFDGGTINVVDREPPTGAARRQATFVLSHGVTLSVRTWLLQLDALPAAGFRTIAFDHRGHGASELGAGGHSVSNLADDVRGVLEGLDLHDVVLVGHSMGGIAVQSFVARFPHVASERLAGLVLLSTLARSPGGSQAARVNRLTERLARRTPDTTALWAAPNLGLLLARFGFGSDPKPSHVELVRRMMLDCSADTRAGAPRSLIGFDLADALASIAVPTMVVCGTADLITPLRESQRMASAIPSARLEVLAGGGHMLMLERAAALDALLTGFAVEVTTPAARHRESSA